MTTETQKTQAWQEQQDRTWEGGHDTINRVITDLRKLADGLEHYRDAYDRAMVGNRLDYSAAKDHLLAAERVLDELAKESGNRLTATAGEVDKANDLWHAAKIEAINAKQETQA